LRYLEEQKVISSEEAKELIKKLTTNKPKTFVRYSKVFYIQTKLHRNIIWKGIEK
jgi:hypothetical protein